MTNHIGIDSTVERSEGAHAAKTGDEMVIMGMDSGQYFGINAIGAVIWEKMESPMVVRDLIVDLLEKFEVERGICEEETLSFLKNLKERDLLKVI